MSIEIFKTSKDKVINSVTGVGVTNYEYALEKLCPLIDSLDIQRNTLSAGIYKKMQADIEDGAILPPITIAFIDSEMCSSTDKTDIQNFINNNINKGFILDGIQRLSAIKRIHDKTDLVTEGLDLSTSLYVNFVIGQSSDILLYRMITLNNGQKPMSPRHQIEILYKFSSKIGRSPLTTFTEKSQKRIGKQSFKESEIIKAYLAYLSNTFSIENKKVIESKMDELLADKIIENKKEFSEEDFSDVLTLIASLCQDEVNYKWFSIENNLIGFCSAIRHSFECLKDISSENFRDNIESFDEFFRNSIDVSKIKLGAERRRAVNKFIYYFKELKNKNSRELLEYYVSRGWIE